MGSSNTIIAALLVVSIAVSAVSLITPPQKIISLTGFATAPAGTTQLSVNEVVSISLIVNSVDWGAVSIKSNVTSETTIYCDLYSNGPGAVVTNSTGNCASIGTSRPVSIEFINDGSENVTVDLLSDSSAAQLLGGTTPVFQYKMNTVTAGGEGCVNMTPTTFTDINTTSPGTRVCPRLDAIDSSDQANITLTLSVPSDFFYQGSRTATLTLTATEVVD